VEREPSDELEGVDFGPGRRAGRAVAICEADPAGFEADQSSIGDGDPVSVAAQVLEGEGRRGERGFGEDYPVAGRQSAQPGSKPGALLEGGELRRERQAVVIEQLGQTAQE
jgi:hypothetical protein